MSQRYSTTPLTDYIYSKASKNRIPISGTFELSPVCNFSCRMCYVHKTQKEVAESSREIMTLDHWLEIAKEAREAGMLYLLLTGGEPFLWPDFWELYEQLIQMGFLISINTNGSLIDDKVIERLKRLPPKRVNITLYGANDHTYEVLCQVKGTFHKVDYAIRSLQEAGIQVKLNGSLTPYNAGDLRNLVKYSEAKKLILQVTTYMFPPIRRDDSLVGENDRFTPEEAARYRLECFRLQYGEKQYQSYLQNVINGYAPPPGLDESCIDPLDGKIRCRAGKASFWITWDGWMTPCGLMNEPKIDIKEKSFSEAWKDLVDESNQLVTSGLCVRCANQEICHPCAAMGLAETGDTSGVPEYLCKMVREMRRIACEELGEQYVHN
ncbi:MAG: radical SAM protein [Dorea sp.]|nr:radical SAM protein [Dorea sp.]